jgi:prostaglandin-E synthase
LSLFYYCRVTPPSVLWAQRANLVFLTVALEDCKDPDIKVEKDKLHFKGVGGTDKSLHEITIEFLKEIDPEKSKYAIRDRVIEFALEKKDNGFWERLLKDKAKQHWLKVDFNKWKDEDDSDEEAGGGDLEEVRESSITRNRVKTPSRIVLFRKAIGH